VIEADEQFDLPVRAAPETSTLILQLGSWEGPLDLLLTLARAQKVDLAQISILALVDQYLGWLAYLKSLLLLPKDPEAEPDPAELALKLQFQLQRLEAMRESGQKLLARPQLGWDMFRRPNPEGLAEEKRATFECSYYDLLSAYGAITARRSRSVHVVRRRPVMALDEAIERLEHLLGRSIDWTELVRFLPADLADESYARSVLASSFVAALELTRQGKATLSQGVAFAPILLRARHD
jgi:segregation and condensation protein A